MSQQDCLLLVIMMFTTNEGSIVKRIAIIGSRGIPAKYGGFETFAEGLSTRLVEQGYNVTVSCEYEPPYLRHSNYKSVRLVYFPISPPRNYFLRKVYENTSDIYFLSKLSRRHDIIYFLGIEVGIFCFIPRLLSRTVKLMVNIDGVMWMRGKFSTLEKFLLKLNHYFAIYFADKVIVDAEEMKKFVPRKYYNKTAYISYGIDEDSESGWDDKRVNVLKDILPAIGPEKYWLVVARLEPENNIHTIVEGFVEANMSFPLLIIGEFTSNKYREKVQKMITDSGANNRIYLLGSIYDQKLLNILRSNCFAYIHGHSVGGTNPSLIEAMIMKNIIVANDNGFNKEVCGEAGLYFKDSSELEKSIIDIESNPQGYVGLKEEAYKAAKENYSWNKIAQEYDLLFNGCR
jgi:rhamnosyltransferase